MTYQKRGYGQQHMRLNSSNLIAAKRAELGFSQAEFADYLGMAYNTYNQYEIGRLIGGNWGKSAEMRKQVADAFKVSLETLTEMEATRPHRGNTPHEPRQITSASLPTSLVPYVAPEQAGAWLVVVPGVLCQPFEDESQMREVTNNLSAKDRHQVSVYRLVAMVTPPSEAPVWTALA